MLKPHFTLEGSSEEVEYIQCLLRAFRKARALFTRGMLPTVSSVTVTKERNPS